MSEQAAARQVHCAAGLCFTSSHPCTSCSVMLTVIESTQAAASEADGKRPLLFRDLNSRSLDKHCSAFGPGCSLGFLGFLGFLAFFLFFFGGGAAERRRSVVH